jgi:hypothetical protein
MLVRAAIFGASLLYAATICASETTSNLALDTLSAGQAFEIRTVDRVLRCELVDPATGESTVRASQDGEHFGVERRVFLLGATHGQQPNSGGLSLVIMYEIREGMRVEIGLGSLDANDRRVTSPVRAIKLLPGNDAVASR